MQIFFFLLIFNIRVDIKEEINHFELYNGDNVKIRGKTWHCQTHDPGQNQTNMRKYKSFFPPCWLCWLVSLLLLAMFSRQNMTQKKKSCQIFPGTSSERKIQCNCFISDFSFNTDSLQASPTCVSKFNCLYKMITGYKKFKHFNL